ncbi:MAG: hypothetical protein L0Z55_11980 [Planctomycetes bacterium]|nr:hypothetical protein [Planctomycetota bacterium]
MVRGNTCKWWTACVAAVALAAGALTLAAETGVKGSAEFEAAWEAYRSGKAAEEQFAKVADDQSQSAKDRFNATYVLAVIAMAKKDHAAALSRLDAAEKLIAGRPQVAIRRAEILVEKKDLKEAAKALKKAQDGIKKNAALQLRHQFAEARLEHAAGATDKAILRLEKMSARNAKNWEIHFVLGTYYEAKDDPKQALAHYDAAIANDPKQDPHPGVYALQRWAALAVSSDPGSYSNKQTLTKAIARYRAFLDRARANNVPADLVQTVTQAMNALEMFGGK